VSEEISQQEAFDGAGSRFAKYYASFAEENQSINEKLEEDLGNIFSTLDIFRFHKEWTAVAKLIHLLDIFLEGGGYLNQLRYWLEQVYDNYSKIEDQAILTANCLSLASLNGNQGMRQKSLDIYDFAIRLAEKRNDVTSLSQAYYGLGTVFNGIGEFDDVKQCWQTALMYANQANDAVLITLVQYNLTLLLKSSNDENLFIHQIHDATRNAVNIFKRLGQEGNAAKNLLGAFTLMQTGQFQEAKGLFLEVLETFDKGFEKQGKALVLYSLGLIAQGEGDPKSALDYFRQSLEIAQALNDRIGLTLLHSSIGMAYMQSGRFDLARPFIEQSVSFLREDDDQERLADDLFWFGYSLANTGSPHDAELAFEESKMLFTKFDPLRVPDVDEVLDKLRELIRQQES